VYLQKRPAASLPVEVIHILGNDILQQSEFFHLNKGVMPRIGFCQINRDLHLVGWITWMVFTAETSFPPLARVIDEFAVGKIRGFAMLGPESSRAAEGRYATLDRQSGPRQRYHVVCTEDGCSSLV
jgi:hypothetical protein